MRVLVFGDSIANGFYDPFGGWVDRLKADFLRQAISEKNNDVANIFNLGVSGDFTASVIKRFEAEAKARVSRDNRNVIIFAIGANDTIYRAEEDFQSTPAAYAEELNVLLSKSKEYTEKVVFISMFPVIDKLLQPFPWSSTGRCYNTRRMKQFNEILEKFCQDHNVGFIDIWSLFEAQDIGDLLADGIHPNEAGHKLIFETVKPKLEELIT